MQWMFLLRSSYQRRVESKILQVLDHHMLEMESFSSMRTAHDIWISFVLKAEQAQAERIRGLLGRLQNIKRFEMFCQEEALSRTTAIIKIWCDQESRLPILQVLTSMEASMLFMTPFWIAFEVRGASDAVRDLHEVLSSCGVIESFSAASLVVHTGTQALDTQGAEFSAVGI